MSQAQATSGEPAVRASDTERDQAAEISAWPTPRAA